MHCQRGWRPKTKRRMSGGLNTFPGPRGESCCDSSAHPRSKLYFANTAKLCFVASSKSLNLNSGAEDMLHGVLVTCLIRLIRSLGQSKCWVVGKLLIASRMFCLGSGEEKGKSVYSPSILFTWSFVVANLCSSFAFACTAPAVLAALVVADVDVGSHGFSMPGADACGYCCGRRLISSNVGGKCAVVVLAALVVADVDIGS